MKKLGLLLTLATFSLCANLEKEVDALDVDEVRHILEKTPNVLTEGTAIKLINNVLWNKKMHALKLVGGAFLAGGAAGSALGLIAKRDAVTAVTTGLVMGLLAIPVAALFFPENKYNMLLAMLSKPLTKEQLKLLGLINTQIIVNR